MAKVITFAHHKGGTGKTTSCISIAGYLAKAGKKVLVVDLDPQGNATSGLGIDKNSLNGPMFDIMNKRARIKSIIIETSTKNIHLAPANSNLMKTNVKAYKDKRDALLFNSVLNDVKKYYDYILVDTPPSHGHFIINAALASDDVVLVLDAGIFALEGIAPLQKVFKEYGLKAGKEINISMALLTKCRNSWFPFSWFPFFRNPTKEVGDELKRILKDVYFVPYSDKIYESQIMGVPISHYEPRSNVGLSYEKITGVILNEELKRRID